MLAESSSVFFPCTGCPDSGTATKTFFYHPPSPCDARNGSFDHSPGPVTPNRWAGFVRGRPARPMYGAMNVVTTLVQAGVLVRCWRVGPGRSTPIAYGVQRCRSSRPSPRQLFDPCRTIDPIPFVIGFLTRASLAPWFLVYSNGWPRPEYLASGRRTPPCFPNPASHTARFGPLGTCRHRKHGGFRSMATPASEMCARSPI